MENYNKGGFGRRTGEDRRDYGSRNYNNDEQRPSRPKRPRITRSGQGGEKLFSSNEERRFTPAGEHRGPGSRTRNYGERREFGERRSYG